MRCPKCGSKRIYISGYPTEAGKRKCEHCGCVF